MVASSWVLGCTSGGPASSPTGVCAHFGSPFVHLHPPELAEQALAGGRRPPRRDPFILHSTAEASPVPSENPPRKERSEGRINLLNNKNPAHLLMKCNDLETCKMDRAVTRSRSP